MGGTIRAAMKVAIRAVAWNVASNQIQSSLRSTISVGKDAQRAQGLEIDAASLDMTVMDQPRSGNVVDRSSGKHCSASISQSLIVNKRPSHINKEMESVQLICFYGPIVHDTLLTSRIDVAW